MGTVIDFQAARIARLIKASHDHAETIFGSVEAQEPTAEEKQAAKRAANRASVVYNDFEGTKYQATKHLRTQELAPLIRKEIKAAIPAGKLPQANYKVRTRRDMINVDIKGLPFAVVDRRSYHPNNYRNWSSDAQEVRAAVQAIINAYDYDRGCIDTDYFNSRFCGFANLDDDAYQAEAAELRSQINYV